MTTQPAPTTAAWIRAHGTEIVALFDAHEPGHLDGTWHCPKTCGWTGPTEAAWCDHLADKLANHIENREPEERDETQMAFPAP